MRQALLAIIDQALWNEDIESLIESGAAVDEYTTEATEIASAVQKLLPAQLNEASLIVLIGAVWVKFFNRSPDEITLREPSFRVIARAILQAR